ncbi:MAG: hypothetical protein HRU20_16855 [Pseudomonadales bacterium]|nr:hypothetical protein [Pseudomonadales bacterium]
MNEDRRYGRRLLNQSINFTRPADNKVSIAIDINNYRLTYDYLLDTAQHNTHAGLIEPKLTTVTG